MPQTFSYDIALPTWLDYARWRVDDTNSAAPLIWNETYMVMYNMFGPVEGLARAAASIAVIISERVSSFGEASGIHFNKANLNYFQKLPDLIRIETPFAIGYVPKMIRVGGLKTGRHEGRLFNNTLNGEPILGIPDTVRIWKCQLLYPNSQWDGDNGLDMDHN